ncbi:MAG: di-trans,poly-cis-decaprenylcistransferase [Alphaproteobacteria bacterium]|nr:MAG: di-trans,poly-cis-decaprenylcistransferase [Alphaproteobacteria bacterium]
MNQSSESPISVIAAEKMPKHIAIIMDGNARWAQQHGKNVSYGHRHGAETLRNILKPCIEYGIHCLSVYAFSRENWSRPHDEVADLMLLLDMYLRKELKSLIKQDIKLHISGDLSLVPKSIRAQLVRAMDATRHSNRLIFNICLSYGSRQEITEACRRTMQQCIEQGITPESITDEMIAHNLYTSPLPELDLLIRTGGDMRLSNFLLWQAAYAELYFTDTLWPDFKAEHLEQACAAFAQRERRYGKRRTI